MWSVTSEHYAKPAPTDDDVNAEHDKRVLAGAMFSVTGYGDVPLEGSLRTQNVLLALDATARDLKAADLNEITIQITDRDNTDHYLTADQIIELMRKGKEWMQAMHAAKRALKTMDPIPADYADDEWWPPAA